MDKRIISDNSAPAEAPDLKRKLAWRMGFAGLMIVALLATLAVFDRLSAPDEPEPSEPRFTERVPVPKKEITQAVKQADPLPEVVKDGKKVAEPEATAAPVDKSSAPVEAPPRPEVHSQPVLPQAAPRGVPHVAPHAVPPARTAQPVQQAPAATPAAPAAQIRPTEARPAAESAPVAKDQAPALVAKQPTAPPRLFSGYALQAGVFSDPRLAEELHAKLTLNGIPSTLETRVQVGPFNSREEAEAARIKMKELGIDALMSEPPKGPARR
jgi:cell division protein FtsN